MPFNLLAVVGSALVNKMLNPPKQDQPIFQPLERKPKVPFMLPSNFWDMGGVAAANQATLGSNPIVAAYNQAPASGGVGGGAPAPAPEAEKPKTDGTSLKDTFLQSLVSGLGQRMFAGNSQPQHTYAPPIFRQRY